MYARILVPLDGSPLAEQVLPYVKTLAMGLKTPVALLRAVGPAPAGPGGPPRGQPTGQMADVLRTQARDYLDSRKALLQALGVPLSAVVRDGDPASIIIQEAEKEKATLIAISTHGRSGVGRWLLGSVTDKVLHATQSPLLAIRPNEKKPPGPEVKFGAVVVPLDGSLLAEQVLPYVVALAKPLALKVLLVQVLPGPEAYWGYGEYPGAMYMPPIQEMEAQAREYLQNVQKRLVGQGITPVDIKVVEGRAANWIIDSAKRVPDSLVAITTHGRSGVGRWILGSVADRVIRHAGQPVLLVRAFEGGG